jgi:hypothetical protein
MAVVKPPLAKCIAIKNMPPRMMPRMNKRMKVPTLYCGEADERYLMQAASPAPFARIRPVANLI